MSTNTSIEWTRGDDGSPGATWNVVTGCTRVSAGCEHCYIERTPPFRMAHRKFNGPGIGATTGVKLHSERLHIPLTWRKPRRIFVCSLADLFQDEVPTAFIAEVFAVMSLAPQHTFQCLTKRHGRLRSVLNSETFWDAVDVARVLRGHAPLPAGTRALPGVWIGVSVENQTWADVRIPALLDTPAAVRWVSAEPLLGPLNLSRWLGQDASGPGPDRALNWVVTGGESGSKARPLHPQWARDLRDQCVAAGVAYHFKQFGQFAPVHDKPTYGDLWLSADGETYPWEFGDGYIRQGRGDYVAGRATLVRRHRAKHDAGRLLDGREWNQFPEES